MGIENLSVVKNLSVTEHNIRINVEKPYTSKKLLMVNIKHVQSVMDSH